MNPQSAPRRGGPSRCRRLLLFFSLSVIFIVFCALGTWQVQRRATKLDLITRVNTRIHAPAIPAPGPDQWQPSALDAYTYHPIRLHGWFLYDKETLVQANTQFGPGYWVITPLTQPNGISVLINRGFVPTAERAQITRPISGTTPPDIKVTGLLRLSESASLLRPKNVPTQHRWYTRDVHAIATFHGLPHVAPYFIDAAAATPTTPPTWPQGGMTVVAFPNNHLIYAITWYILALMTLGAGFTVFRRPPRNPAIIGNTMRFYA